ncbi:MAG: hypothetical protein H7222_01345 [Methylotenera sp.]|nr:hypothetical protein [Oligoflexia bacterium]
MGDKPGLSLTLVTQPQAYFHELVQEALGHHQLKPQPETEMYLVNLLNQFMTTDRLYARDSEGHLKEEPLAFMVRDALEQDRPEAQRILLRQVGDVSLYTAGFFQDSLNRKFVDLDYYIDMGGTAYKQVAARAEEQVLRSLYEELAHKFASFVEVLAAVSDRTAQKSEKDLLRMYELWIRTKSERAAKALQAAGILPTDSTNKKWQ